jgi:predicted aconitase
LTGEHLGTIVPYFRGLGKPSVDSMKAIGAACATSGGIALWHGEGVTPETEKEARNLDGLEAITVERVELDEAAARITSNVTDPLYCLGCPHCSIKEIAEVARMVEGKQLQNPLWIFTSRIIHRKAERQGYVRTIEKAGGKVYRDTCMVVAPLREMGWNSLATNSFKAGHYASSMGLGRKLLTVHDIVVEALK